MEIEVVIIVDIHSHILWGVDDGPKSMNQSLNILEQVVKEGITSLISTSHSNHPRYNTGYQMVTEQVEYLQQLLIENNIPLTLYTGHEVRLSEKIMPLYHTKHIHTLANSNYLLLELPSHTVPFYINHMIAALLMEGITPIIAHPERNLSIAEKPSRLLQLIHQGALAQITAGSLTGHFGRNVQKLSLNLVNANLVHCYGSDVHNMSTRPLLFEKGLRYLEKKKHLGAVDILLENNERIIQNKPLIIQEPLEIESPRWWKVY